MISYSVLGVLLGFLSSIKILSLKVHLLNLVFQTMPNYDATSQN